METETGQRETRSRRRPNELDEPTEVSKSQLKPSGDVGGIASVPSTAPTTPQQEHAAAVRTEQLRRKGDTVLLRSKSFRNEFFMQEVFFLVFAALALFNLIHAGSRGHFFGLLYSVLCLSWCAAACASGFLLGPTHPRARWLLCMPHDTNQKRLMKINSWIALGGLMLLLGSRLINNMYMKPLDTFPEDCPKNAMTCVRITYSHPRNNFNMHPIEMRVSQGATVEMINGWITNHTAIRLLNDSHESIDMEDTELGQFPRTRSYIHAEAVKGIFGFSDDIHIQIDCGSDGYTKVQLMSVKRVGNWDVMNNNFKRIQSLYEKLNTGMKKLPNVSCFH